MYQSPRNMHRYTYFEVLEVAVGAVKRSPDQADIHVVKDIETIF